MMTLKRCWVVAKKDMLVYYARGPVLIFGIFFPACLFFAFALGRGLPPESLAPGLIGMSLFFAGSAVTPAVMPFETRTRTIERLVASPVTMGMILAGDCIAALLFGLFVSALPLAGSLYLIGASPANPWLLVVAILLSATCYSIMGALFSAHPTDNPSGVMTISNLVRLPMIFFSGVFIPVAALPTWGRALAAISPLTYTTELLRASLQGGNYFDPGLCVAMLALFCLVLWPVTVAAHKWAFPRRL
ncbi:MAG: ABC transporter permease [Armatimonadetes bacterium]|nr:ABC transporter permease [Armatimonadota bacterium]